MKRFWEVSGCIAKGRSRSRAYDSSESKNTRPTRQARSLEPLPYLLLWLLARRIVDNGQSRLITLYASL